MKTHFLIPVLAAILVISCTPRRPGNINAEQVHNPAAQQLISPGFGTMGVIHNGILDIYYQDDQAAWHVDGMSQFIIPEGNEGVIAMGLGIFGVVINSSLHFYSINDQNEWEEEEHLRFDLPRRYDRLTAMRMPWQIGAIGIETRGVVDFYFLAEEKWDKDPQASFVIPEEIKSYYPLGEMTIAIRDEQKLGLYFYAEDEWDFMDHDPFILLLPEGHKGIIPMDNRFIGILDEEKVDFYQLDMANDRWVTLSGLHFELPI